MRHDEIQIAVESKGFYKSLNKTVALTPKILIVSLIFWVGIYPDTAGSLLMETQLLSTKLFGGWYIYATAFFMIICMLLALFPKIGKLRLGSEGEQPEFRTFTWLSMMFGAGIGIGMLTYLSLIHI